jgi:hypothetical protein
MSANTSPDNIVYPTTGDSVAPLETVFANMATSVQNAFTAYKTIVDSRLSVTGVSNSGSAITGITTSLAPPAGSQLQIRSGFVHAVTTSSFGNGYMPTVTFAPAFPTSCTSVQITAIHAGTAIAGTFAIDSLSKTSFRALVPSSGVVERAFTWIAVGY